MLPPDIAHALGDDDPLAALRHVLIARIDKGASREDLIAELERERQSPRGAGRERDEDLLLEALDLLTGWCAPDARI